MHRSPDALTPIRHMPTTGMIRALADDPRATELDYEVCRRRGLLNIRNMPTTIGRALIGQLRARMAARKASRHG